MLQKNNYSKKIIELFQNDPRNMPEIDFESIKPEEIVQYGYLAGAKKVFKDMSQAGLCEHLNLPGIHMYTPCGLNQFEHGFRNQNAIFDGSSGTGKSYLSANLAKNYFCNQFIPSEYRESENFFDGIYAQGILHNNNFRKIIFVSESHCLDMYSRKIQNITADEYFNHKKCYGSWDLDDLHDADFLAIQDIGSRKAHPQFAETIFSILDHRFEDFSKVTIFTTNADKDSLTNVYGQMFTDRLKTFESATMEFDSKRKFKKINRTTQKFDFYTGE